jgi:hypothetical protein
MINLMPPDVKEDIRFAKLNVSIVQYCILAAIVGIALVGILLFGLLILNNDRSQLEDGIVERQAILDELKLDEDRAKKLSDSIDTIGALFDKEVEFSEIIVQIGSLIPAGSSIDSLTLPNNVKKAPLNLIVRVPTQPDSAVLQQNFANSPLFKGADIQSVTPANRDSETNQVVDYSVQLVVSFASEEERAEAAE